MTEYVFDCHNCGHSNKQCIGDEQWIVRCGFCRHHNRIDERKPPDPKRPEQPSA